MAREYWEAKAKFLEMYGYVCACCGEANPRFLTLDHVRNDGKESRESVVLYTISREGRTSSPIPRLKTKHTVAFLKDAISKYQPEVYQVLCYNCNFGRAHNDGICPHKQEHPDIKAYRRGTADFLHEGGTGKN